MPYNQSALRGHAQAGDPFVGGLLKGVLGVAGTILPGPVGAIARVGARALGGGAQRAAPRLAPVGVRGGIFGRGLGAGLPGIGALPKFAGKAIAGPSGFPRRRRRINPSNAKAARRAVRRLESWHREMKKVEKVIRKLKGPSTRRARADLPRGHRHVR